MNALPLKSVPLDIDFHSPRPVTRRAGWLLLALALAFAADVGFATRTARDSKHHKQQRIAEIGRLTGASARPASPEELAAAADAIRHLSLPWDALFASLESAAGEGITLTGLEPDPKAGTVRLTGEAKDYGTALAYVQRLREAPALARTHLVKHELRRDDARRTVAFVVAAAWKGAGR